VDLAGDALNEQGLGVSGATILVLGVAYKPDVNDARESPAITVIGELQARRGRVFYHDPYVPSLTVRGRSLHSVPLDDHFVASVDCVVILTDHACVDYKRVVHHAARVVDTRNATRDLVEARAKIVRL
jgi:UDP-N-acetyl-D-glucosamine dehydrogenase